MAAADHRSAPAGLSRWTRRAVVLTVATGLALGLLEVVLRTIPDLVNPRLGNYIYSAYGAFPGGIYVGEETTGIQFMRADFATENYWNGYRWHHRTDARGFRNPPGTEPRVVLLGDSLIYGHGIDEEATVAHRLRQDWGVAAYNMARQGDCLFQEYVLLRLELDRLRPERALLFVFLNDVDDLFTYRTRAEIADPPELARWDYRQLDRRVQEIIADPDYGLLKQPYRSRALRLLLGLAHELPLPALVASAEAAEGGAPAATDAAALPPYLRPILDDAELALAAGYYRRLLADLARRTADRGTVLTVVYLDLWNDPGPTRRASLRLETLVAGICRDLGIPFATTGDELAGRAENFLPGDGHFSPLGHQRLAELLARRVLPPGTGRPEHRQRSHGDPMSLDRIRPCPRSPNCVSTRAGDAAHHMPPIPFTGTAEQALERLRRVVRAMPRSRIVEDAGGYLRAEFRTAILRFTDDVELAVDPAEQLIHFRSASRVGYTDLGANRRRIDELHRRFEAAE